MFAGCPSACACACTYVCITGWRHSLICFPLTSSFPRKFARRCLIFKNVIVVRFGRKFGLKSLLRSNHILLHHYLVKYFTAVANGPVYHSIWYTSSHFFCISLLCCNLVINNMQANVIGEPD